MYPHMPILVVHFARFGPYHLARIESARVALAEIGWDVCGLETGGGDATYAWHQETGPTRWRRVTVFPSLAADAIEPRRLVAGMRRTLDGIRPDAMAIAGWGSADSRVCLAWCREHDVRAIVMSETRAADGHRVWWKEVAKRYLISRFQGALVGGRSHRDYLVKLGMPSSHVLFGYDVVDNAYFKDESTRWKAEDRAQAEEIAGFPSQSFCNAGVSASPASPYFLASNRFIERKNLLRLIEAYAAFWKRFSPPKSDVQAPASVVWNLCLLGDGEEKPALLARCRELGLQAIESAPWDSSLTPDSCPLPPGIVFFPGFRQIEELPRFYAHAGCFIHPALAEPWGLVLNEAMACGLPVLSSSNVGAAEELIDEGTNGWTFDPLDVPAMAAAMTKMADQTPAELAAMGESSCWIVEERCPTSKFGHGLAALLGVLE